MLKRNSGFIIGCVVAAGVSFFAADVVMSDQVTLKLPSEEAATENDSERQLAPEMTEKHTYETDPFTVTADGTVVKGVETESPKQSEKETEQLQTDADGNVITPQTDENGSAITPQTDENGNIMAAPATVEAETPVPAAIPETAVRAVETETARDRLRRRMT